MVYLFALAGSAPARQAHQALTRSWFATTMNPTFFPTSSEWRQWLVQHHRTAPELWVGFYKKDAGRTTITWPESVDEALCFGWIDGLRKRVDELSYTIRFSPRRPGSIWSRVNINRAEILLAQGRMLPVGREAFAARQENKSGIYSYEQRTPDLEDPYRRVLQQTSAAWEFFAAQPASYRKAISWWIVSAKREETRLKRLAQLTDCSARGERVPAFLTGKPNRS